MPLSDQELYDKIRRSVPNKHELQVLESFLVFNKHVLKTNFYQPTKVALSFRLAPDFLPDLDDFAEAEAEAVAAGCAERLANADTGGVAGGVGRAREPNRFGRFVPADVGGW